MSSLGIKALQIISTPYDVYTMGYSYGNFDRTFLNDFFEHKNCISIKPYYYKNGNMDNYLEIIGYQYWEIVQKYQEISRI